MRTKMIASALLLGFGCAAPLDAAGQHHHGNDGPGRKNAPYAGLQTREISSLSADDLAELRRGGGWGLALPAELNGMPGPAHVLELRNELGLSPKQAARTEAIFASMRDKAIKVGAELIAAERALDAAFKSGEMDPDRLAALISVATKARGRLRRVHLSAHLAMRGVLTDAQRTRYRILRGYAAAPCAAIPHGHDPVKWRRHSGCD